MATAQRLTPSTDHRLMPACRLYLVGHGTTLLNGEDRYLGRRDIPLDAQGYQDAVDAARRLSGAGLTAVYTGPLRRAVATAQIIADAAGVPDLRILNGLNNLDYGVWEGMTAEEAAAYEPQAHAVYRTSPAEAVCPQGERLIDAQRRMIGAIRLIGSRHPGEPVVAVAHAVMIRLVLVALEAAHAKNWRYQEGRGVITEFHVDGTIQLAAPTGKGGPG
jgi:broad specificity phosphatase PhoE